MKVAFIGPILGPSVCAPPLSRVQGFARGFDFAIGRLLVGSFVVASVHVSYLELIFFLQLSLNQLWVVFVSKVLIGFV